MGAARADGWSFAEWERALDARASACGAGYAVSLVWPWPRKGLARQGQPGPKRNVAFCAHLRIAIVAQSRQDRVGLERALDRLNL